MATPSPLEQVTANTFIEGGGSQMRKIRRHTDEGFTLVELLVIVVILGILAAIVVFGVSNIEGSSAKSACKADYKLVESAQEAHKAEIGTYATSVNQLVGEWLKEAPSNNGHYAITIDTQPGSTYGDVMVAGVSPVLAAQDGPANCSSLN